MNAEAVRQEALRELAWITSSVSSFANVEAKVFAKEFIRRAAIFPRVVEVCQVEPSYKCSLDCRGCVPLDVRRQAPPKDSNQWEIGPVEDQRTIILERSELNLILTRSTRSSIAYSNVSP